MLPSSANYCFFKRCLPFEAEWRFDLNDIQRQLHNSNAFFFLCYKGQYSAG